MIFIACNKILILLSLSWKSGCHFYFSFCSLLPKPVTALDTQSHFPSDSPFNSPHWYFHSHNSGQCLLKAEGAFHLVRCDGCFEPSSVLSMTLLDLTDTLLFSLHKPCLLESIIELLSSCQALTLREIYAISKQLAYFSNLFSFTFSGFI